VGSDEASRLDSYRFFLSAGESDEVFMPIALSSFWKNLAWDQWLYGLLSAIIGGGSTAASGTFAVMGMDPEKFNFNDPWKLVKLSTIIFLVAGLGQMWAYLKQNSLPAVMTAQTASEKTEVNPSGATVTTKTTSEITVQQPPEQKGTAPNPGK
jgi:hypothetical protein